MRFSVRVFASMVGIWIFAFCLFLIDTIFYSNTANARCDDVVVLTGEKNRIPYAIKSININKPKNMFISGVYQKTTLSDILGKEKNENNVLFILGKNAKNTFENAIEINNWLTENGIKKIILITSDYHMRRSILEIQHANKELEIIPYSSRSSLNFNFLIKCIKEFHKTIYVFIKNILDISKG